MMSPKSEFNIDASYLGPGQNIESDGSEFSENLHALAENKGTIIAVVLFALLASLTYLFVAQPTYSVDALLQVEAEKSSLGALDEMAELFDAETPVNAEIEILRSRSVIGKAVDRLQLNVQVEPKYLPVIGPALARRIQDHGQLAEPWYGLVSTSWGRRFAWGGESLQVETFEVPEKLLGQMFTLVALGNDKYALHDENDERIADGEVGTPLRIDHAATEIVLFVSELTARPDTHFMLVRNSRIETIEKLQERLFVSEKGKQSGILQLRLEDSDPARARHIVNEVANLYLRQNVEQKSAEAEQTLSFLEVQLPILKEKLEAAEAALNSFRLERGSVDLSKETQVVLDKIVTLEADHITLKQQREELLQRFTPRHPRVVAVDAQIRRITSELQGLTERVKSLPDTQQEILRLSRDVEVNTQLYTSLLNSAQELRVVKAGTVGNVRIIDYAVTPTEPVKPKAGFVMAMAMVLGFCAAVSWVMIRRALTSGVEDPDMIERQIGLPVYASIPHSDTQKKISRRRGGMATRLLAQRDPQDLAVESFRSLRTTLHFALLESTSNVVAISGPCPGVGKSFVCANLGAVLAAAGSRVLLIDADLRKGCLNEYLGLDRGGGLSELISGQRPMEAVVHRTECEGLDLLPTGVLPPNPAELLLHERFKETLGSLAKRYDHVLIDSPPVLAVTDAAIVGRLSGAALLVVRCGAHPLREIEEATKRMSQAGVNVRGILFNDLTPTTRRYRYGRYVYRYETS